VLILTEETPMAIDIIELVRRQLTPEVATRLGLFTGETPSVTDKALASSVPTILAGMLHSASSPGGVDRLVGLLGQSQHDGRILSNLPGVLDGDGLSGLIRSGSSVVGSLFGPRQDAITTVIANASGARQSSAAALLGVVAPVVLGAIGRQLGSSGGVTGSSLVELLQSQRNAIVSSAPRGLASALGTGDLASLGTNLDRPAALRQETVPERRPTRNLIPLLIGIAALVLIVPLIRGLLRRSAQPDPRAAAAMDTLETGARAIPTTAKLALPDGHTIDVEENTVVYNLQRFLADKGDTRVPKRFTFDHLNFESNTTALTPQSKPTVDNLVAVLAAYPATVIELEGHTDNTGNAAANRKLSQDRANAVAALLAAGGIDSRRVSAKGYGADRPIASNDTEEGRARNRRTELLVVKR
jgi:outer membrane protein OmpA-like peptidoglycan-associated protein